MPSNHVVRTYDRVVGIGLGALIAAGLVAGYAFENWEIVETWIPVAGVAVVVYLLYRFVLAVEHIAYDS
jgi:hypothetical protein